MLLKNTVFNNVGGGGVGGVGGIGNNILIPNNYSIVDFSLGIQDLTSYTNQQILRLMMQTKIYEIRNKPLQSRINEAFIDMGYLDFYTNANWFFNLNKHDCYSFIQNVKNIWDFGFRNSHNRYERILDDTKNKICFLHEPFYNINCDFNENEKTLTEIQTIAIYIMENLIYLGIDYEHKRLGTIYILSALTMVSIDARTTLYWLYEGFSI
jgi:hypothetical protein